MALLSKIDKMGIKDVCSASVVPASSEEVESNTL
jgi:hypothetical protein